MAHEPVILQWGGDAQRFQPLCNGVFAGPAQFPEENALHRGSRPRVGRQPLFALGGADIAIEGAGPLIEALLPPDGPLGSGLDGQVPAVCVVDETAEGQQKPVT